MNYGCGVTGLGKVMCWGPDGSFQAPLPGFIYKNDTVEVRASDDHMCARRTPKSWTRKNGVVNNWYGQTDAPTKKAFL